MNIPDHDRVTRVLYLCLVKATWWHLVAAEFGRVLLSLGGPLQNFFLPFCTFPKSNMSFTVWIITALQAKLTTFQRRLLFTPGALLTWGGGLDRVVRRAVTTVGR